MMISDAPSVRFYIRETVPLTFFCRKNNNDIRIDRPPSMSRASHSPHSSQSTVMRDSYTRRDGDETVHFIRPSNDKKEKKRIEKIPKSFRIRSSSHEYATMSWFALKTSTCDQALMVGEEPDHVPVWGIRPNGERYKLILDVGNFTEEMEIFVSVKDLDLTVGLQEEPARLSELEVSFDSLAPTDRSSGSKTKSRHRVNHDSAMTPYEAMTHLMEIANQAYKEHFSKKGVDVFYTRRRFETVFWQYFGTIPHRPLSSVVLPNDLQKHILSDIKSFYAKEKEYMSFGQPYKMVCCLYGPPGTGKTSVVTAVASELDRSLGIFNADSLRDDTFIELLSDIPHRSILLFEDVDSLFRPDRKTTGEGGMTFSSMLNALDGVLSPRGTVIFLTTNHIDRLDEAISRPGRIDSMFRIPYASPAQAAQMWQRVFPKQDPPEALLALAGRGDGLPPSKIATELFRIRDLDPKQAAIELTASLYPSSKSTRQRSTQQAPPKK